MNYTEFYQMARGCKGTIYTARNGNVMAFCLDDGHTYLLNTTACNGKVVVDPIPEYWCNSIDFSGGFADYFTFGIIPAKKMPYPAEPIVQITDRQHVKLNVTLNAN